MAAHRYRLGERVVFHPSEPVPHFAGPYVVERLLPADDAGPHYQIRSVRDGHERTVAERELLPAVTGA
jgi:hypothetical protein